MLTPGYWKASRKPRFVEGCLRSSSFQLLQEIQLHFLSCKWESEGSEKVTDLPAVIQLGSDGVTSQIVQNMLALAWARGNGRLKQHPSKSETLWAIGHPEATWRCSYLGLRMWLPMPDCREGVLMVSVAREREQLNHDCRLASGWELRMETSSLEAECRILSPQRQAQERQ